MKNADQPAFARTDQILMQHSGINVTAGGLTKREYFAIKTLSALIVHDHSPEQNGTDVITIPDLCGDAIRYADELLKQLES